MQKKRRRYKRKKPLFKQKFFWLFSLLILFAILLEYLLFFSPVFQIQKIFVQGSSKEGELLEFSQGLLPSRFLFIPTKSIFLLKKREIEQGIRLRFPEIENAKARRTLPATFTLTITERKEVSQWCVSSCFALDRNGVVFAKASSRRLLKIIPEHSAQDVVLGETLIEQPLLSLLLEFQKKTEQLDVLRSQEVELLAASLMSKERVSLFLSEGWQVFFNPTESLDWQFTKLRLVLEKKIPPEKRSQLEYIDVRFGNQAYLKYR